MPFFLFYLKQNSLFLTTLIAFIFLIHIMVMESVKFLAIDAFKYVVSLIFGYYTGLCITTTVYWIYWRI